MEKIYVKYRFQRMIRYMEEKMFFRRNFISVSFDGEAVTDYRFRIHPEFKRIAGGFWEEELILYVIETLYLFDTISYRNEIRNYVGMLVCDEEMGILSGDRLQQARELVEMVLNMKGINPKDIYEENNTYFNVAKCISKRIVDSSGLLYYHQIVKPIMEAIEQSGAFNPLFQERNWRSVAQKLPYEPKLDEDVVKFLVEDALDYIEASDCFQYNPFWVFGSGYYCELMKTERN